MQRDQIDFQGWKATRLRTPAIELVIPHEVGPRVIRCATPGGPNLFAERPAELGGWGEDGWMIRGGHRLWHAPQGIERTTQLDNSPIQVRPLANGVELEQPTEAATGILKRLEIEFVRDDTVRVRHFLTNKGMWPIPCAPWALSVMAYGGYAILPFPPSRSHDDDVLPATHLIPWQYTDLSHPAWKFAPDRLGVDMTKGGQSQKIGINYYPGWQAYWQESGTFAKFCRFVEGATYPDHGSAGEFYHCDWMIELETLAPLNLLAPGATAEHVEYWTVITGLPRPDTDAAYRDTFKPRIEAWLRSLT